MLFSYCYGHHPDLHSFPTRRSSDLELSWDVTGDVLGALLQRGEIVPGGARADPDGVAHFVERGADVVERLGGEDSTARDDGGASEDSGSEPLADSLAAGVGLGTGALDDAWAEPRHVREYREPDSIGSLSHVGALLSCQSVPSSPERSAT